MNKAKTGQNKAANFALIEFTPDCVDGVRTKGTTNEHE